MNLTVGRGYRGLFQPGIRRLQFAIPGVLSIAGAAFQVSFGPGQWGLSVFLMWFIAGNAAAGPVYPVKPSASGRYLVDQNNVPFMIVGDSPQALVANITEADAAAYFTNRNVRGFNTLWINLLCTTYTAGRPDGSTIDGTLPFTGKIPGTGSYDLSATNELYFAHVDRVLNLAAQQGLLVMLNPIETGGWLSTMLANGPSRCRAFGQYLGNRYKDFPNIVWLSGNDYQGWSDPNNDAVVTAVALGIKDTDTNHIHTIELNYQVSSSLDDPNWAPIIGLNGAYTYYPTYAEVLHAWNQSGSMPVFLVEANYEYENLLNNLGPLTPKVLRLQEYWTLLSGGAGQLYGNHYTWQFANGWQNFLDTPGAIQMGYLNALFQSRPWYALVPDTSHTALVSGYGSFSSSGPVTSNGYATAARTTDGALLMAYLPSSRTVTVNMSKLGGTATARWFDPAGGNYVWIAGSPFTNSGTVSFTTPGNNVEGASDWVLVIETNPPAGLFEPSIVQQNYRSLRTSLNQVSSAYGSVQTAGDADVIAIGWIDATANIVSVTDSAGNSYRVAVPPQRGAGVSQAIYYAANIKAGTDVVTVKFDQPANAADLRIFEYSGIDTDNPFDAGASTAGNSAIADSGSLTNRYSNELLFAAGVSSNMFSAPGAGFGLRVITSPAGDIVEDRLSTSPGAYNATATMSAAGSWLMQAAAFKMTDPELAPPPTNGPALRIFLTSTRFTLQECSSPAGKVWTDSTNVVRWTNGSAMVVVPLSAGPRFYRLKSSQSAQPPALSLATAASNNAMLTWQTAADTAVVAWPAPSTGFNLLQTCDPGAPWSAVTNAMQVVDGENQIALTLIGGKQFYRLSTVLPVSPPVLRIFLDSGGAVVAAWPTNAAAFRLQQNSDLTTSNWMDVPTGQYSVVGVEYQVTVSTLGVQQYYRLKYP